jgi:glycosyltransferase involved in cell wall biosynthesis
MTGDPDPGPGPVRVGVLGGTRIPGNVATFLRNVRDLLESPPVDREFELLVRAGAGGVAGYDAVDPGIADTDRALDTIRTLTTAATRYARADPPDVLFQVTKFPVHGFAATVAGRRTGVPVVTRFAGDNFREHLFSEGAADTVRTYVLNNLAGQVPARFARRVIVLGPHGRAEVERRRGRDGAREIPQPVDFERFHPVDAGERASLREELGMPNDRRVLLTVGRLSGRKGMADLAAAARTLRSRGADVRWYVVGEGPFRDELEDLPLVDPVGRVPHDRVPDYYRAADLLVHPSLIEGLPNVLLEAAACGLPTVSRAVGDAGTVASTTYDDPSRLPDLVLRTPEPVDLGERFDPETLRREYADVLLEAARGDRR